MSTGKKRVTWQDLDDDASIESLEEDERVFLEHLENIESHLRRLLDSEDRLQSRMESSLNCVTQMLTTITRVQEVQQRSLEEMEHKILSGLLEDTHLSRGPNGLTSMKDTSVMDRV